jgi:chromosome partitioning protein
MEISQQADRVFRLKQGSRPQDDASAHTFSYVLLDCPPSFNLLTMNAMAAAHSVLVPLQCEFFALEGLEPVAGDDQPGTADRQSRSLDIQGIVLTMFDSRNNLAQQVVSDVREHLGEKVYAPSFRAMFVFPKRHLMVSRLSFTISNAPAARPISSWLPKSFSASGSAKAA